MTKTEAVKALRNGLSFNDPIYAKSFNEPSDKYRLKFILEKLLERIKTGWISHQEYFIAVQGLQWCILTGRATYQYHYLHSLKLQDILRLIEDIKRKCETFSDVETYIANMPARHVDGSLI